ncbi:FadR/GntR family transcriptional regulator [Phaeobacter sp. B1627]|uniref:FadR/GntR family transcriptional regulator n=1 Tax=Phaeobacter sp. B1627 TaxID=2583809 RepID=UPI00111BCCE0|nr:FadR/GntR family transcriptional regulator [Phaeobacter sp. B1627]TNJ44449.1 FadR family transcriptional regulator [Phaeobacter sp. B1627]
MTSSTRIPSVEPIKQKVLSLIRSGDLTADGKLPTERVLAGQFDVSRRAVRLALDSLEEEGLVWRKQGKGTFAGQPADPTAELAAKIAGETNALQVMEARLCIEPELAALCAKRMQPEELARLRRLAQRQFESNGSEAIELWDGAFHRLIAQCARNRPLLTSFALLDKIRSNREWIRIRARARSGPSLEVSHCEHVTIIEAIETGDPDVARTAMRDHLTTRFDALRMEMDPADDSWDTELFDIDTGT